MNGGAYIMVVLGILLAKGIGFMRDMVFAWVFGATAYTDIYFQVYGLVNLIFTGIGVALSTLVIKNLNKPENASSEVQKQYVSCFIVRTTAVIILVTALMYAFAGPLVKLLLPGLDSSLYSVAVKLMYIMLPSFLFVVIAYIISGVLQNNRVFFITSIMSLPFNVIIISSLFVKNIDIITVGIVTTIGWFLHIVIQLPHFYSRGYRLFSNYKSVSFNSGGSEVLFIFISNMMFQLCFLIDKAFVSSQDGAATTINYASNLFVTIASVFVVAMSNVVFPSISKNYEEGNISYLRELQKYIITVMYSIFLPFILVTCCFGESIISLLYQKGEFTAELSHTTGVLFAIYTLGVFGYVCQELLNKILYLDSKYSHTVIGTVAVVLLKPLVNMFVAEKGGVIAVAASTAVLLSLYAVNVAVGLCRVTGNYIDKSLVINILKVTVSGGCALGTYFICRIAFPAFTLGKITFIIPLLLCGIIYCGAMLVCGMAKVLLKREVEEKSGERIE